MSSPPCLHRCLQSLISNTFQIPQDPRPLKSAAPRERGRHVLHRRPRHVRAVPRDDGHGEGEAVLVRGVQEAVQEPERPEIRTLPPPFTEALRNCTDDMIAAAQEPLLLLQPRAVVADHRRAPTAADPRVRQRHAISVAGATAARVARLGVRPEGPTPDFVHLLRKLETPYRCTGIRQRNVY